MMELVKQENLQRELANLEEEKREKVLEIKNSLVLSHEGILSYSQDVSKKLTDFSTELLKTMKLKDTPEVESIIIDLMSGIESIDVDTLLTKKSSFIKKLFRVDELKMLTVKYDDVSSIIGEVTKKLSSAQYQLKKDINLCEMYLKSNIEYINELDMYIIAGKLKVEEERREIEYLRANIDTDDMLEVQELAIKDDEVNRLERKLHDLTLMRAIAIQNIPQIRLIRDGDAVLIEKIQSSISSAIPLWESQMVIAIQLVRQQGSLKVQKAVTDTTNKLIEKNSELLKVSSTDIAKELERGIIDIDVLKKSSENLIETLKAIKEIRANGVKAREQAAIELGALQMKLNETLLLPESN